MMRSWVGGSSDSFQCWYVMKANSATDAVWDLVMSPVPGAVGREHRHSGQGVRRQQVGLGEQSRRGLMQGVGMRHLLHHPCLGGTGPEATGY